MDAGPVLAGVTATARPSALSSAISDPDLINEVSARVVTGAAGWAVETSQAIRASIDIDRATVDGVRNAAARRWQSATPQTAALASGELLAMHRQFAVPVPPGGTAYQQHADSA